MKMKNDDISVFKSYLRRLLHDLMEIEKAKEKGDDKKADELLKNLIEDTKKGLED